MATATKRQKAHAILASSKKDLSPKWDNAQSFNGEKFSKTFREAMSWYNLNKSGKELKPQVINWMANNGYTKEQIKDFKRTKDSRCGVTVGAIASCLNKGMPPVHAEFNNGKNTAVWLANEISKIINDGANDVDESEDGVKTEKTVTPVVSIQDRIREQAGAMSEEIDYAIDSFVTDPESFDPKQYNLVKLLRGKGAKAAQARYIKSFFVFGQSELAELSSGHADDQLKEAYKHLPRKHVKKLIEFYDLIMSACDQIAAEAKVMKKPRAKKVKPAEDLVKKLNFKTSDDKLGIVSVPPAGIIGAQMAVTYNVKTRKLGVYISKGTAGLSVKGTSITDFTDKSFQKTLRKPVEQLKEFKEQNTQKRVETWFGKIKSVETRLNGRINADIVILKVFK